MATAVTLHGVTAAGLRAYQFPEGTRTVRWRYFKLDGKQRRVNWSPVSS
jgi:hypothetical protein